MDNGECTCSINIENSIELMLRLVQCGTSVEVLEPKKTREKFVALLSSIFDIYRK